MFPEYKRTIIQVPLDILPLFNDYAQKYSLSLSSAIVMLAKKSIEQEEIMKSLPGLVQVMQKEHEMNSKKTKSKTKSKK